MVHVAVKHTSVSKAKLWKRWSLPTCESSWSVAHRHRRKELFMHSIGKFRSRQNRDGEDHYSIDWRGQSKSGPCLGGIVLSWMKREINHKEPDPWTWTNVTAQHNHWTMRIFFCIPFSLRTNRSPFWLVVTWLVVTRTWTHTNTYKNGLTKCKCGVQRHAQVITIKWKVRTTNEDTNWRASGWNLEVGECEGVEKSAEKGGCKKASSVDLVLVPLHIQSIASSSSSNPGPTQTLSTPYSHVETHPPTYRHTHTQLGGVYESDLYTQSMMCNYKWQPAYWSNKTWIKEKINHNSASIRWLLYKINLPAFFGMLTDRQCCQSHTENKMKQKITNG